MSYGIFWVVSSTKSNFVMVVCCKHSNMKGRPITVGESVSKQGEEDAVNETTMSQEAELPVKMAIRLYQLLLIMSMILLNLTYQRDGTEEWIGGRLQKKMRGLFRRSPYLLGHLILQMLMRQIESWPVTCLQYSWIPIYQQIATKWQVGLVHTYTQYKARQGGFRIRIPDRGSVSQSSQRS